jgi:hypothetical protein
VVTSPKITKKRDKNNHDKHPNTPISIKRGINVEEEKEVTFPFPQNWLQLTGTISLSFPKKNLTNPAAYAFFERLRRREN